MGHKLKGWLRLAFVVVVVGLLYAWASGTFRSTELDFTTNYVSQKVPPPSADQKKVVLQNLGMT